MKKLSIVINGLIKENPTFVLLLGMCPTLGTTSSALNGMSMGIATMAVLMMSNMVIAGIRNFIPDKVRIPAYIVVIASFVTLLQMLMQAYLPELYATLGIFIPLIVALTLLGAVREFLGTGKLFGFEIYPESFGSILFVLAPGAFIVLGLLIALVNKLKSK